VGEFLAKKDSPMSSWSQKFEIFEFGLWETCGGKFLVEFSLEN
jgi:hypothetical protein